MTLFSVQFNFRNTTNATIKMDSDCFRRLLKQVAPEQTVVPDYASSMECMLILTHLVQQRQAHTINGIGVSAWIDFAQIQLIACSDIQPEPAPEPELPELVEGTGTLQ